MHNHLPIIVAFLLAVPLAAQSAPESGKDSSSSTTAGSKAPVFTIEVPSTKGVSAVPGAKAGDDPEKRARALFESKTTAASVPANALRIVNLRLSGSLCPACLRVLQKKLETTPGIVSTVISRPKKVSGNEAKVGEAKIGEPKPGELKPGESRMSEPPAPRFAEATIVYDSTKLSIKDIKHIVSRHDLFAWKIEDRLKQ
ncbi:MAG TPA: hypothetical protein V6D17_20820 [Candidatus Obscuribacterales bacterium]